MKCSICGKEGHSKKNCPEEKNYALWVKFDNISVTEAISLSNSIVKTKQKLAPQARGTSVQALKKELPSKVKEALKLEDGNYGKKK